MMVPLLASFAAANLFWFILFSPLTAGRINFWAGMAVFCGLLAFLGLAFIRRYENFKFRPSHLGAGVLSAFILYLVFAAGHQLSVGLWPGAQDAIGRIYLMRAQLPAPAIALLLAFVIAPAEEIFWRGFLQGTLSRRFGTQRGYFAATAAYALVHVYALNIMLIVAALVCGAFWGYLYRRQGSLWPVIISHALWDVMIFIVMPLG